MRNMKALTLTNQKMWPMLKFLQTKTQTNGQAKNYMPPIYQCVGLKILLSARAVQVSFDSLQISSLLSEKFRKRFFFPQCFDRNYYFVHSQTHRYMDGHTNGQIYSSITPKKFVWWGYKKLIFSFKIKQKSETKTAYQEKHTLLITFP